MLDFIRHECLNLIIARKQFVKDSKQRIKEERQKKKEIKNSPNKPELQIVNKDRDSKAAYVSNSVPKNTYLRAISHESIDPNTEEVKAIPEGVITLKSVKDHQYMSANSNKGPPSSRKEGNNEETKQKSQVAAAAQHQ